MRFSNPGSFVNSILRAASLSGALALVVGCGGSASSICTEICDCEGCSDTEHDDCVDDIQDAEKKADDEGCNEQYSALASCISDQLECRDGDIDSDGCGKEDDELEECMD